MRLHPLAGGAGFSNRAQVADTLRFRRRKGTAAMLEDLARVSTGFSAHAVEFFETLSTTQHLNHVRLQATRHGRASATPTPWSWCAARSTPPRTPSTFGG